MRVEEIRLTDVVLEIVTKMAKPTAWMICE